MKDLNRRGFMRVVCQSGVAVTAIGCGQQAADEPTGPIAAGNVKDVASGSLKVLKSDGAVLARDDSGLYAMSAVCTHEGCALKPQSATTESLYCDCHGSSFDREGNVTHGPARRPLPHYRVDLGSDGSITIQGGQTVASDVRTPVPA